MEGRTRPSAKTELEPQVAPARRLPAASYRAASPFGAAGMLALQRAIGNQAVGRLARGLIVQPKLEVGPADDRFEQEADRVADEVMRTLAAQVTADRDVTRVSRSTVEGSVGFEGGRLGADTEAAISRERGGGARLPDGVRGSMESSFGADFSSVRVHTGPSADALTRSMQARAFTVGRDIFFARDEYQPETKPGQRLLAHELTHTLQQGGDP